MVVDHRNPQAVLVYILVNVWYTEYVHCKLYFYFHCFRVLF